MYVLRQAVPGIGEAAVKEFVKEVGKVAIFDINKSKGLALMNALNKKDKKDPTVQFFEVDAQFSGSELRLLVKFIDTFLSPSLAPPSLLPRVSRFAPTRMSFCFGDEFGRLQVRAQ
jgi:hypothetical protein